MPIYYDEFIETDAVNARSLKQRFDDLAAAIQNTPSAIPSGVVQPYAGTTAQTGWLLCDGSAVSRATYAALFAVIGTTFGSGDGSSTFNVPDMRGRTGIGAGTGSGLTARTVGQQIGEENHQLTASELPAHTHSTKIAVSGTSSVTAGSTNSVASASNTGSTGSDTPHNNMQPSLVLNWIIKT